MVAVGVDVSNGTSTVAVVRSKTEMAGEPFTVQHTVDGVGKLVKVLDSFTEEVRIVMEYTGNYHAPIAEALSTAGYFVCCINPLAVKEYRDGTNVRKVKTDKADALKIAHFALDNWDILPYHSAMDTIRFELKDVNRQFQTESRIRTELCNSLISKLELCYPGIHKAFESPVRNDGSQKWVDFVDTFWHKDCVAGVSLKVFSERYCKWCKRHGYLFSAEKAAELHADARQMIAVMPKSETCKFTVKTAVESINAVSRAVESLRSEMYRLASQLPEFETVMQMTGVGKSMGPQLIAEIGDIRRFTHQKSLVGFAGTDPIKSESGDKVPGSSPVSKRGSPCLRKTLFIIMTALIQLKPQDDPVYQFIDKKRSEGKHYHVYMTAGMTKFLRIYYGKVRDALIEKGLWEQNTP